MNQVGGTIIDVLKEIVPGVTGGIVTALVTVRLALRRYKSERWWERKAQAYADILDALYHVKTYLQRVVEAMEESRSLKDAFIEELAARSSKGRDEIRRTSTIGSFVVSKEAWTRLQALQEELDDPRYNEDPHEAASGELNAVTTAIDDLREMARRDLRLS